VAYFVIEDFQRGLDLRKSAVTAPAGSLRKLKNANLTPGGEIEKAKDWVPFATVGSLTRGLYAGRNQLEVYVSEKSATIWPGGTPPWVGVSEVQLNPVRGLQFPELVRILSADRFNGRPYIVAEFDDGNVHHYYDGARVTAWDSTMPDQIGGNDLLHQELARACREHASFVQVYGSDDKIVLVAPEPNKAIGVTATILEGTQTVGATAAHTNTGTDPEIWNISINGTYDKETLCQLEITYDGQSATFVVSARAAATPRFIQTFGDKVYGAVGPVLYFTGFTGTPEAPDPTAWTGATGSGFINVSTQSAGAQEIRALSAYQTNLAVFSDYNTQIWSMDPDPDKNVRVQTLDNVGALSAPSVKSFGEVDLFFLSATGVRSLRARDSSNVAGAQDVGSPVDEKVAALLAAAGGDAQQAPAAVNPRSGQYLLAFDDEVLVFSHFPGAKVSGWSSYVVPGDVEAFANMFGRLFMRSGDTIYVYGGLDNDQYPSDVETEVQTPFLSAGSPATQKTLLGLDIGCEGSWTVYLHPDPSNPDLYELLGTVEGTTYGFQPRFAINGQTTHFSLRFVHQGAGYARLSNVAVHYQTNEAG